MFGYVIAMYKKAHMQGREWCRVGIYGDEKKSSTDKKRHNKC